MLSQRILDLIRREGSMSRAELARRVRVSKPTVSTAVAGLLELGLLREGAYATSNGGRRPRLLDFNARAGFVIGMDIGASTARAVLADLRGEVVASARQDTARGGPAALIRQVSDLRDRLRAQAGSRVVSVAIGTPGVVEPGAQAVRYSPKLPALESPGFTLRLEEALGLPVSLHNDVNLAAVGEMWRGAGRGASNFAFFNIGTGLGLGLVLGGRLYQGAMGRAGELGYLPLVPGSSRLLEDALCGAAIASDHRQAGGSGDPQDAFDEAELGREPGAGVLRRSLERLAWVLAAVATLLDPEKIILGGGIGMRYGPHLNSLHRSLAGQSAIVPELAVSRLGDEAGLHGALATALDHARQLSAWTEGGETSAAGRNRLRPDDGKSSARG